MQYKETTATKMLTGQWGAAMNYIETHKPIVIKNRDHHDIIMLLASDYEDMRLENNRISKLEMLLGVKSAIVCDNFDAEYIKKWAVLDNKPKEVIKEWYSSDGKLTELSNRISGKVVKVFPDQEGTWFEFDDNNFVIHDSMLNFDIKQTNNT